MSDAEARRSMSMRAAMALMLFMVGAPSMNAQVVMGPAPEAPNAAFLEVGGPGGFYSANYDLLLNSALSVRFGATSWSTMSFDKQGEKLTAAIVGAAVRFDISQFVDRQEGRYLEMGATLSTGTHSRSSYDTIEADGPFTTLVPMIGIRYQPPRGGFMYRATFTPFVPLSGGTSQYPQEGVRGGWASLSAGYAF